MYKAFRRKMIIMTLLISFVPLALLGYTLYYSFAKAYHQKIDQQTNSRLRVCAQTLDIFLEERLIILSAIANMSTLEYYQDISHLQSLFQNINQKTGGGIIDLGVINSSGEHLAYIGPYNLKGLNYSKEPWFDQVMIKGTYISDVYMGYRKIPHFIIAVRSSKNGIDWILRATIDLDIFTTIVSTAQMGKTGDAFIINREGVYQSPSRFQKNKILTESEIDTSMFGANITVMKKGEGPDKNLVYNGLWIKNGQWLLVVSQNPDENVLSFSDMITEQITLFLLALLGIVATTVITTSISVNTLQERDKEVAELNAHLIQTDKLAALGKMAAGVAHEINNPLGIISTKAGWMRDLLEEDEFKDSPNFKEFEECLDKIEEHVQRAGKITHNMLGFARSMEPTTEKVDINAVLTKTTEFLSHHAQSNNIRIKTDYDQYLPEIISDKSQLQQVFLNILNNAIDAIEKEGDVVITTKREHGSRKDHEKIVIDIIDTGSGIPEHIKNRIFDPFFTTKEKGKGTGLGLSISYRIIEKLGGTISVKSEKDKGSTFTISLPVNISNGEN
ncbi:MAG: GHKL domain-containing protein [Desulfamplus sp.]|nr:GHKL domain-containing protein [Desulfamplus sp.]